MGLFLVRGYVCMCSPYYVCQLDRSKISVRENETDFKDGEYTVGTAVLETHAFQSTGENDKETIY